MRKTALLLAAAAVAVSVLPASAAIEPLLRVGDGGCPAGYSSLANVNDTHVCLRTISLDPDAEVSNSPCADGYTEVGSAAARKWVCVRL